MFFVWLQFVFAMGDFRSAVAQCSYEVEIISAPSCGVTGIPASSGFGLNDLAIICGRYDNCADSDYHRAFVWFGANPFTPIVAPPPPIAAVAYDINDFNQVVGILDSNALPMRAFLYQNGVVTTLDLLPGFTDSEALAINNKQQIVGDCNGGESGSLHVA